MSAGRNATGFAIKPPAIRLWSRCAPVARLVHARPFFLTPFIFLRAARPGRGYSVTGITSRRRGIRLELRSSWESIAFLGNCFARYVSIPGPFTELLAIISDRVSRHAPRPQYAVTRSVSVEQESQTPERCSKPVLWSLDRLVWREEGKRGLVNLISASDHGT